MTATCWQIWATTGRSWVTKIRLTPVSRHSPASSRRIWSWIVTSSAVVGSSQRMISGSQDSAIAIITRWRMPPENSCGYARNLPLRVRDADPAHQLKGPLRGLGPADAQVDERALGDLGADPHDRVERAHRLLEDHRHLRAADAVEVGLAQRHQVLAIQQDLAGGDARLRRQHAEDGAQRHALAGARLPDDPERIASGDLERHPVHRADQSAPAGDLHVQVADLRASARPRPHRCCAAAVMASSPVMTGPAAAGQRGRRRSATARARR